ncbi:NXPE family member 3-like [Asterias rubens]|uniref:NXPE family member 3-like n=1 Tax=Asterias rubens TaxID=7604 RepID=UPI001455B03A|nr:NXPE family member 3-like [Asterias rubens]
MLFNLLPTVRTQTGFAFCALLAVLCLVIISYIPNGELIGTHRLSKPSPNFVPHQITHEVTLVSPRYDSIRIGDLLHYHIHSKLTDTGGEFYQATLSSRHHPKASTAGHFVDHTNGTYSAYFYAGWSGQATLSIVRVFTREAVTFLKDVMWNAEDRVVWQGFFYVEGTNTSTKQSKTALCTLRSHGNWSGMCVYPHLKALGSTVFLCEKLPGINCNSLYATKSDGALIEKKMTELAIGKEKLFDKNRDYRHQIHVENSTITISGTFRAAAGKAKLLRCLPDEKLPPSHGYWIEDHWISLICSITDWTSLGKLSSCLRNKNLILLGDSTTRQWFVLIHRLLLSPFNRGKNEKNFTWRRYHRSLNATILFTSPPQLVGSLVVFTDEVNYEVDVLDGLNDSYCNYIILISPWAHYTQWVRSNYVQRTQLLRKALLRMRKKCPDVKIVLKGSHARDHESFSSVLYSSDFFLKEIDEINRDAFSGIGVWYLPIWAMNMAYPTENSIHMPLPVILEELRMFFSYVCDENSEQ